jgi:hypothetical protein
MTDYLTGKSALDLFSQENLNYQYVVGRTNIKFNTTFPKEALITVDYTYAMDQVRFKAILRRTLIGNLSYTPILKDYTVIANTIK